MYRCLKGLSAYRAYILSVCVILSIVTGHSNGRLINFTQLIRVKQDSHMYLNYKNNIDRMEALN